MKFREIAWNGFLLEIPEDMRLAAEGGNFNSGYLRCEMEGLLLEVKWDALNQKKTKPLAEIANSFVKDTRKTLEKKSKKKIDLKVKKLDNIFISSHSAYSILLETMPGLKEPIHIWNCEKSKRVVILHFVSSLPEKENESVIRYMVNSFKCHLERDSIPWIALNLRFSIPSSFLLADRKIAVGRTYLTFEDRKFSTFTESIKSLTIEYFSMANLVFSDTYKKIEEWFQNKYWNDLKKRHKNITFEATETKRVMRHNVLHKYGMKKSGLLTKRTMLCENFTWYCSKSNRIYSVTYTSSIGSPFFFKRKLNEEEDKKIVQEFLATLKCHP